MGVVGPPNRRPTEIFLGSSCFRVPKVAALDIGSDDPGVLPTDLSEQYWLLVTRYRPSYATLKSYVLASIRYSFLSDRDKAQTLIQVRQGFEDFEDQIARTGPEAIAVGSP